MKHLDFLQTETMHRPYTFDRVEVSSKNAEFSIVGKCYSEFRSGPNLRELANAAGEIAGEGYYGLRVCRYLGWRQ
jgi:hypothetical protein